MEEGDTMVNAVIGAVVNVVAGSFIPFAPLVGGGVAGYLEGGSREDGLKVGALAGAIALIPMILLFFVFGGIFFALVGGASMAGGMPGGFPMFAGGFWLIVLFLLIFGALYVVGLSAVGGWLGNYVKYDTDVDI